MTATRTVLPYGLKLGQRLTDFHGNAWVVRADGLHDLIGDADWDWPSLAKNGGLGLLRLLDPPVSAVNPVPVTDGTTLTAMVDAELRINATPPLLETMALLVEREDPEDSLAVVLDWATQIRAAGYDWAEALDVAITFYFG